LPREKEISKGVCDSHFGILSVLEFGLIAKRKPLKVLTFPIMSSLKEIKQADKIVIRQKQVLSELNEIAKEIERCEKTMSALQIELASVNSKFQGPRNTRQDVEYLTGLLNCAKKKLNWEKHLTGLQKRIPVVLESLTHLLNDPKNPPADQVRTDLSQSLHALQTAMERLQNIKVA
jgi:chromosome segregation ATPase